MEDIFIFTLLFISRIIFVSPLPIYFDGPEYIRLISNSSLIHALTLGHAPIHPGFILPAWLLNKVLPWGPVYNTELLVSLFSALGLFVFYKIVYLVFDKKTALKALIIASLLPALWLLGVNVMVDNVYIFFYLFALYSFFKFLQGKSLRWFVIGVLSVGYAVFTHVQVIIWLPVFIAPLFLKKPFHATLKQTLIFLTFGVFLGVGSLIILEVISRVGFIRSFELLFLHGGDFISSPSLIREIGVYLRNLGITLLRDNTSLIILGAILGAYALYKNDKRKLGFLFLWMAPILVTSQYWHIGLFGRVSVIASFSIAILVAQIRSRIIFCIVVANLIIVSIPLVITNKYSPVQKELEQLYSSIPSDSTLISSNLIRPQVSFKGSVYFINEPGQDINFILKQVSFALKNHKKVFIDSQAIYNPYYSLDGNNLHVLSLGKTGHSAITPVFKKYKVEIVKIVSPQNRVFLYQINGKPLKGIKINRGKAKPGTDVFQYSNNLSEKVNHLRFDYYDIGTLIEYLAVKKKDPISWTIADKSGYFKIPVL